jgi:Ca-activated chloride channel family protein
VNPAIPADPFLEANPMRLVVPALTLLACAGTLSPRSAPLPGAGLKRAAANPGEAGDATLSPYFWVRNGDSEVDRLPLKATSVKAAIAGVIADVRVTQVYRNEGTRPLEAVYVFPGSTRAAVHGMTMTIGERTIQARIRERDQARQEYEQARQEGRSASLLEQQRPNVFQMNVANILPGDEIRVELAYTELLVPTEGVYEFVYPTVVGPRYSNTPAAQAAPSEPWVANPYTRQGEPPLSRFDLEVRVGAGLPIQRMACATHRTTLAYDGADSALLKLDPSETSGGNRDFVLKYQLAGGHIQSGLLLYQGKDENFFLLMVQPPRQVTAATLPPREYIFIMDVSGSMNGYPIETSKVLMRDLVSHLGPRDTFNFLAFEGAATVWSPSGSRPGTPENLNDALAFVGRQGGGGGTEIIPALRKALALPRTPGVSRTFVIATDGYISVEPKVLDVVRENLGDANMFAFGIGTAVNRFLIEGIAHAGMGEPFVVTRPEEAEAQARRFRQYVAAPVLTGVKAGFNGFQAYDVEPLHLPDVLAERPVVLFGKWKGKPAGTIQVTGRSASGAFSQSFDVARTLPAQANSALAFLWARHRIQFLGDYAGLGDAEAQRGAITELGLKYGLLTAYTSFVAVDTQARNLAGDPVRITQPLPLPEGVSNLAVGRSCAPAPCLASGAYQVRKAKQELAEVQEDRAGTGALPRTPAAHPAVRPGAVGTDVPGLAPAGLDQELQAKLADPVLAALLAGMPQGTVLELRLDATGAILSARFTTAFADAAKALRIIRGWRLKGWTGPAGTTLRVPLLLAR